MAGEPLSAVIKDAPRFFSAIAPRYRALLALQSRLAWSESKRRYLAFAFLFGLSALAVMGQLQSILAAMHLPGETSFDVGDLAFPDRSDAAVTTWTAHAAETTAKFSGPLLVTVVFALVDSLVLVPAYALFLAIASAEAHQRLAAAYTAEQAKPAETRDPLLKTYRRLAAAAFLSVPLLVATDLLENAGFVAVVAWKGDAPDLVVWLLAAVSALKWLLAGGIVVALLFAAVALARRSGARGRGFLQTAAVLRIEIFVALVLAVFLFGPIAAEQMDDVIRRWIGPDWNELLTGSLLALLLSAVIAAVSWRLLVLQQPTRPVPTSGQAPTEPAKESRPVALDPVLPLAAGLALIGLAVVLEVLGAGGMGVLALGLVLAFVGGFSYPLRNVQVPAPRQAGAGSIALPAVLAAIPPVLLGLALIRSAVFELVYAGNGEYLVLILLGLVLQIVGWTIYLAVCKGAPTEDKEPWLARARWPLPLAAAVAAAVAIGTWLDPWRVGEALGTIGIISAFLIALVLLGFLVRRFEHDWLAPPFFLIFGFRRFPVVVLVLVWAIVAALLDPGGYHNIRTITRTDGEPVALADAWQRWLGEQDTSAEAVPLVLVAAEGGGIRAAYWTARALDCAIDADTVSCGYEPTGDAGDPKAIFAASGISGSSLGLVAYTAAVHRSEPGNWPDLRLGDDFIAAAGAWTLFADLPNSLFKFNFRPDSAAVLERAWQHAWGKNSPLAAGLLQSYRGDPRTPLLLLSGTSVQDGCRVNNSPLNADVEEPKTEKALRARDCLSMAAFASEASADPASSSLAATHDLYDQLCNDQDIRLSTAALLSARFPYVSPAGRVPRCGTKFATYVVDGGYFDTSAASPIQELWARLEPLIASHNRSGSGPCVVPFMLQLDNHYKEPRSPGATGRPWETGVPLIAVRAARDARESGARQATALLFSAPSAAGISASAGGPLPRYAHLFPRAHPGTSAPLGWALSQASMDDLTNQLRERANQRELGKIRRWFSPELRCEQEK